MVNSQKKSTLRNRNSPNAEMLTNIKTPAPSHEKTGPICSEVSMPGLADQKTIPPRDACRGRSRRNGSGSPRPMPVRRFDVEMRNSSTPSPVQPFGPEQSHRAADEIFPLKPCDRAGREKQQCRHFHSGSRARVLPAGRRRRRGSQGRDWQPRCPGGNIAHPRNLEPFLVEPPECSGGLPNAATPRPLVTRGDLVRAAHKAKAEGVVTRWEKDGVEFIIKPLAVSGAGGDLDRELEEFEKRVNGQA
jgi:hypothetical protein